MSMTAEEFTWQELSHGDLLEGVVAVLVAPVVLPIAAGMNQPLAKQTMKGAIAFSQRCREAIALAGENFEDLLAEAQAELDEEAQNQADEPPLRTTPTPPNVEYPIFNPLESSAIAEMLIDWVSDMNAQAHWLTNGYADLRLLMPLGLSALALQRLWEDGLELDEIPWYNLAWYAFDSFNKLNHPSYKRPVSPWEEANPSQPQAETTIPRLITDTEKTGNSENQSRESE